MYPITHFTVGPLGLANYQTIQSAIDAANINGGGLVFIQAGGSYTENLTMYPSVDIRGASSLNVSITGTHTPPTSGSIQISNITFISATDIFNTTATNSIILTCINCIFEVTDGYTFNTPNLAGTNINIYNCFCEGTNDGFLSGSTGGITLTVDSSTIGNGSINTMSSQYDSIFTNSTFFCPVALSAGGFYALSCLFVNNVNITELGDGMLFSGCVFGLGGDFIADLQININTSGFPIYFENCVINTTNSVAVTGTADEIYFSGVSFPNSAVIADTITFGSGDSFNCGSGIVTTPVSSASSSVTLGSAYQNTTGHDVLLTIYFNLISSSSGSILCGVGPTNTPTQQTIVNSLTLSSASIVTIPMYLPNNYYVLISTSGTVSGSITGQQITTI